MSSTRKKEKRLATNMKGNLLFVFTFILVLFAVLIIRLIYCTISEGKHYETIVLGQQNHASTTIEYERGKIYDRNGNVLAANEKIYALILEPKNILGVEDEEKREKYIESTVTVLCRFFSLSFEDLKQTILDHPDSYYQIYKTGINFDKVKSYREFVAKAKLDITNANSDKEKNEIELAKNVRGVVFEESYKRIYPYGSLACKVIGFTSDGNVGNWGLEQYYNDTLNGTPGRSYSYFNDELVQEQAVKEAENGSSLISTIDMNIQQVIEKKIKDFDERIGSKMTSVLVMDPNNCEILGMASSYPYDLNSPMDEECLKSLFTESEIESMKTYTEEYERKQRLVEELRAKGKNVKDIKKDKKTIYDGFYELWRNSVISDTYEPGSVFKPLTVAAGLDSGKLSGNEEYSCSGALKVNNRNIGCSHVHGTVSLKNSVAQSCNVAMMNISFKEGAQIFYDFQHVFGFGKKTGIDLPGEAAATSLVYNAENYANNVTLATNAFGQNFNCTMVQMGAAFASLINGGYYYKPHVVKQIVNNEGDVVSDVDRELVRTTVSAKTSKILREYMEETVLSGTGVKAKIDGYSIGGKTGTAEKIPRNKKDYYISFMGFVPVDDPQLMVYATIDEPGVDYQANAGLAVELERECMEEIIKILGIKKSK